jgi:hypothetical protein
LIEPIGFADQALKRSRHFPPGLFAESEVPAELALDHLTAVISLDLIWKVEMRNDE